MYVHVPTNIYGIWLEIKTQKGWHVGTVYSPTGPNFLPIVQVWEKSKRVMYQKLSEVYHAIAY